MKIHVVQENETLWTIAQKYGVDFEQLIAVNQQISDPDMIMPGMKIKIPSTSNKQDQAPSKKQQTIPKQDKQEVVPVEPTPPKNQIVPEIKEDEDKKWEPLKKELPSLPINFNKQQPPKKEQPMQPVMPQQEPSQDLKWLQFTSNMNNFETNIQPVQPKEEKYHQKPESHKPQQEMPKPHYPMQMPQVQPAQMQAPCYSQEGIPFGGGHMQPMHHMNPMGGYPFPDNFQPDVMGASHQQMPMSNQAPFPMPQSNMMPQQQPMPQAGFMPQQQSMPQNGFMPQQEMPADFMAQQQPMPQNNDAATGNEPARTAMGSTDAATADDEPATTKRTTTWNVRLSNGSIGTARFRADTLWDAAAKHVSANARSRNDVAIWTP
ncbi:SafA/ExsA family spore coat assembly protein [Gracilibacillus oryzae]|uniref:SafA/ExsA family spore coat assembly protein n=1 Tax=Gracilibacillus oryzae TaxID=1672701 RepID=UPI001D18F310|nr:SafA/ExsA family spore coat assembly protein [Gracilibacillus oryzae]